MKIITIYALVMSTLILASCDMALDPKIDNTFGDEWTWTNPDKAQGVLMDVYANIPGQFDNWGGNNFLDVATDNAVTNDYGSGLYQLVHGGLTAFSNPLDIWNKAYKQFRSINLFLENGLGDNVNYYLPNEEINQRLKDRLKGEAYFLRGWWGMELLRVYGGIASDGEALGYPIVTSSLSGNDNSTLENVKRNTYGECVEQITNDLDTAIKYLPFVYDKKGDVVLSDSEIGRATKKSAYALKTRVLTYGASPAYQPEGSHALSTKDIIKKWELAALSCYEAIQTGEISNYTALKEGDFNYSKETPQDFLFRKFHNNNSLESRNLPPSLLGSGRTMPTQNLVDAFPAANGYPINRVESNYDPQNPYVNRDPRFYLSVYANGMNAEQDGNPLEIYFDADNNKPGIDAPGYNYQNTNTGYYLRKWLSRKTEMLKTGEKQNDFHYHALIRRAEVFLNWAESSNEAVGPMAIVAGCDRSAYDIIKDIRAKNLNLGIDPYLDEVAANGKEAFRVLIQNERRLDLAFEDHRYFDMRRWKMPLNENVRGAKIERTGDEMIYYGTDPSDEPVNVESREMVDEKYYYAPLPYDELIKNPGMRDNKGWSN